MVVTYKGKLENGLPSGIGEMEYDETGYVYTGEWKAGKRHGKGKLTEQFEHCIRLGHYCEWVGYEGEWENDMKHGEGCIISDQAGTCYSGRWENDMKHGHGCITWWDDSIGTRHYEGEWENDNMHGKGILENWDLSEKYEGEWKNGEKHGKFEITDKDGNKRIAFYEHDKEIKKAIEMNALTNDCCSVCQEDIYNQLSITKCGHAFHTSCLLKCYQHKSTCPMCRSHLIV